MTTHVPSGDLQARERQRLEAARRKLAVALDDPARLGQLAPRRPFVMPRERVLVAPALVVTAAAATAALVMLLRRRMETRRAARARMLASRLVPALLGSALLGALAIREGTRGG